MHVRVSTNSTSTFNPKTTQILHQPYIVCSLVMAFTPKSLLILSLLTTFSVLINVVLADIGTATSYHPPYLPTMCNGNRQDQFPPGNLFVAVNEGLWDNGAACGRRYRLRCLSGNNRPCKDGTIDVRVVDFCRNSPCPSTILLSNDAFSAISRSANAKLNVEYIQI